MIRKYNSNTLQTKPWCHEEEPQNTYSHLTSGNQLNNSNKLSHFHEKMISKLERTLGKEQQIKDQTQITNKPILKYNIFDLGSAVAQW